MMTVASWAARGDDGEPLVSDDEPVPARARVVGAFGKPVVVARPNQTNIGHFAADVLFALLYARHIGAPIAFLRDRRKPLPPTLFEIDSDEVRILRNRGVRLFLGLVWMLRDYWENSVVEPFWQALAKEHKRRARDPRAGKDERRALMNAAKHGRGVAGKQPSPTPMTYNRRRLAATPIRTRLTPAAEERAARVAASFGIRPEMPLVTLHVRERGYKLGSEMQDKGQRWDDSVRNASIETHFPAIDALVAANHTVVRIGDPSMTPVVRSGLIDLATAPERHPELELYCLLRSRFILCGESGPYAVSFLTNTPLLAVNCTDPIGTFPWRPDGIFLLKTIMDRASGRVLTGSDLMTGERLAGLRDTAQIEVRQNTSEQILEAVAEMLELLEQHTPESPAQTWYRELATAAALDHRSLYYVRKFGPDRGYLGQGRLSRQQAEPWAMAAGALDGSGHGWSGAPIVLDNGDPDPTACGAGTGDDGSMREPDGIDIKARLGDAAAAEKRGEWDVAVAVYEALLATLPDHVGVHLAYGSALGDRRDPAGERYLLRALDLAPDNQKARVTYGSFLVRIGRFADAVAALEPVIEKQPGSWKASAALAQAHEALGELERAVSVHVRAIDNSPEEVAPLKEFATFLTRQAQNIAQRGAELAPDSARMAEVHGVALSRAGRLDEAAEALERAARLRPDAIDLRRELLSIERLRHAGDVVHRRPSPYPVRVFNFADYARLVRRYVLPEFPEATRLIGQSTKVAAMGSCFAVNVAQGLERRGIDVFYKLIHEDVNSTYANAYLLDWVSGLDTEQTRLFAALYGDDARREWEVNLRECDLFILSLGLATGFFDRETGEFVLQVGGDVEGTALADRFQHRNTSVAENVANLRHIIQRLRELNPDVRILLTLSPVPLGGTYERRSAVLADCVSKSTLRLTVEDVMADHVPEVYYWPSFEMVRWLGAHVSDGHQAAFGADDGQTRHVSEWLRDLIIDLFIETCGDGTVGAATAAPAAASDATES